MSEQKSEQTTKSFTAVRAAGAGRLRRKTGWMRAEAAGGPGPWRQQAILGRSRWDADALRDVMREYALDTLADPVRYG